MLYKYLLNYAHVAKGAWNEHASKFKTFGDVSVIALVLICNSNFFLDV